MKKITKTSISVVLIILFGTNLIMAQTPFSFDLSDLTGSDAVKTMTQAGVTLTASANGDFSVGKDQGSDYLYIASGIWIQEHMTDTESITLFFNTKVTIYSMDKTNGLADEAGDSTLIVSYSNERNDDTFTPQNPAHEPHQGIIVFSTPVVLEAGDSMTFNVQNPDRTGSYRISSLLLIPEPSTYALILGSCVLVFMMCRRQYGGKKQP